MTKDSGGPMRTKTGRLSSRIKSFCLGIKVWNLRAFTDDLGDRGSLPDGFNAQDTENGT